VEYPGDYCCALYSDKNYASPFIYACMPENKTEHTFNLMMVGWAYRTKSYTCGKSIQYKLCTTTIGGCNFGTGTGGAGHTMNPDVGKMHKSAAALWMKLYNPAIEGQIILYEDRWCAG